MEETQKMLDYVGYGWDFSDPSSENKNKEMAVVAVYECIEKLYDVTYIDGNGNTKVVKDVPYYSISSAYGATPVKNPTDIYEYKFVEWNIVCTKDSETGENLATATAIFKESIVEGKEDEANKEPSQIAVLLEKIKKFFIELLAKLGIKINLK